MENLRALGLVEVLRNDVARAGKPFLGICIGIQVLLDRSEEDDAKCLGIIAGRWLWDLFARLIFAVPEPTVPVWTVVLVAVGTIVLANLVAAVPARTAGKTSTALLLRAE